MPAAPGYGAASHDYRLRDQLGSAGVARHGEQLGERLILVIVVPAHAVDGLAFA
ncbi:MAG: hypothetical protein RBT60_05705 [Candidatus Krumholzibacteria bacterium]|jgi:hypothetical protein|nr:hypothetical protein [Candidatus Krumholzibacteria bacterium]